MEPSINIDNNSKQEKYALIRKKWSQDNLDKCAIACKKYYDARKNDPEFKEKLRLRTQMRRERLKEEKLRNPPGVISFL